MPPILEGRWIAAAFDYGDYICQFETGIDQLPRFDAHLEVYSPTKTVRVEYDTPYVRNVTERHTPKTTPEDARQDLLLFREMTERMR